MPQRPKPRVVMNPQSLQSQPPRRGLPVQDIRQTKEYKVAARRWLSTIVALPILMYTSYVLYERTYLHKSRKHLVPSTKGSEGKDGSA
ncbi:hypothetical protein BDV23DRAFT_147016 [Aspergillus alliaceus]|uniref:Uncharacterized protein n=1 Tax=Petromyces alliaceus TaxID=209559 RepID=A0A5N7CM34_PETAA|nr:hypothetical protein BDV23DRAFT_147016 [Aspergillus alliaceus]